MNDISKMRNEIIEEVDKDKVQMIIQGEIELLSGNKLLYERMHRNLKENKFEPMFAKEQMMLYEYRTTFFYKFCGRRPTLFESTPYHITKNFEVVMAIVCATYDINSKVNMVWRAISCPWHEDCKCVVEGILWDHESMTISIDTSLFDREKMEIIAVDRQKLEEFGLGFNDGAQMIMAMHRVGPCSLFESALKATVLNNLSLEEVPKVIQNVASQGLYQLKDDIPQNLSPKGKQLFGRLKAEYEEKTGLK